MVGRVGRFVFIDGGDGPSLACDEPSIHPKTPITLVVYLTPLDVTPEPGSSVAASKSTRFPNLLTPSLSAACKRVFEGMGVCV